MTKLGVKIWNHNSVVATEAIRSPAKSLVYTFTRVAYRRSPTSVSVKSFQAIKHSKYTDKNLFLFTLVQLSSCNKWFGGSGPLVTRSVINLCRDLAKWLDPVLRFSVIGNKWDTLTVLCSRVRICQTFSEWRLWFFVLTAKWRKPKSDWSVTLKKIEQNWPEWKIDVYLFM